MRVHLTHKMRGGRSTFLACWFCRLGSCIAFNWLDPCDWHWHSRRLLAIRNGTNIREGGTRCSPRGKRSCRGRLRDRTWRTKNQKTKKRKETREVGERKRKERGERGFGTARTEIVSFGEREACISLRGCALDNGILRALSSSFRLLTK